MTNLRKRIGLAWLYARAFAWGVTHPCARRSVVVEHAAKLAVEAHRRGLV